MALIILQWSIDTVTPYMVKLLYLTNTDNREKPVQNWPYCTWDDCIREARETSLI